jgi:DNA-binding beta-propeller fold protein YncE
MNFRTSTLLAVVPLPPGLLGSTQSLAQSAYVTNDGSNDVSVIDPGNRRVGREP